MMLESFRSTVAPIWIARLVRVLDDGLRIPGGRLRVGLDPVLGLLLPGAGDALAAACGLGLFWLAFERHVPRAVLLRMAINVLIDALVGSLPVVGDAFDFAFKSNRKNLTLLERHQRGGHGHHPTLGDYGVLLACVLVLGAAFTLPFVIAALIASRLLAY